RHELGRQGSDVEARVDRHPVRKAVLARVERDGDADARAAPGEQFVDVPANTKLRLLAVLDVLSPPQAAHTAVRMRGARRLSVGDEQPRAVPRPRPGPPARSRPADGCLRRRSRTGAARRWSLLWGSSGIHVGRATGTLPQMSRIIASKDSS